MLHSYRFISKNAVLVAICLRNWKHGSSNFKFNALALPNRVSLKAVIAIHERLLLSFGLSLLASSYRIQQGDHGVLQRQI